MTFQVTLPVPPTLNNAYRNVPGKGRVKTREYGAWLAPAIIIIRASVRTAKAVRGPLHIAIRLPLKMRGDIDNRIKPILDALVKSGRIDDDRNVRWLTVWREDGITDAVVQVWAAP